MEYLIFLSPELIKDPDNERFFNDPSVDLLTGLDLIISPLLGLNLGIS
jgi:hypothetical protein